MVWLFEYSSLLFVYPILRWRKRRLRFFRYHNKSYLLTRNGWTRIGVINDHQQSISTQENEIRVTVEDGGCLLDSIKLQQEERLERTKATKQQKKNKMKVKRRRAQLLVKAAEICDGTC